MSVAAIVTEGFGTFGSVPFVVTQGFGAFSVEVPADDVSSFVIVLEPRPPGKLYVGSIARLVARCYDEDGDLADPPVLFVEALSPGGAAMVTETQRLSLGAYVADVALPIDAGDWAYEWRAMSTSRDAIIGRSGSSLRVVMSPFYRDELPSNDY